MAYLGLARKKDLQVLCTELGLTVSDELRVIQLKELITSATNYEEEFAKNLLSSIIEERKMAEEAAKLAEREKEKRSQEIEKEKHSQEIEKEKHLQEVERLKHVAEEQRRLQEFELEKMRLQIEAQRVAQPVTISNGSPNAQPNLQLKKLIQDFNPKEDDMSLYLNIFERQLKFFNIEKQQWVAYLLGVLPSDITQLIAREADDKAQDFDFIKEMLLKRFKLSAEKLHYLFSTHRKAPEKTWKDYHFEIRSYFEGWLAELNITDFDGLKNLMILDQLKKRVSQDGKDHFIDVWCDWSEPEEFVEKMDAYDNVRSSKVKTERSDVTREFYPKQAEYQRSDVKYKRDDSGHRKNYFRGSFAQNNSRPALSGIPSHSRRDSGVPSKSRRDPMDMSQVERPSVRCFGCGTPGVVKTKCPNCSVVKNEGARVNSLQLYTCVESTAQLPMLDITIYEAQATVCADTGATHTIGGELLYNFLVKRGQTFQERELTLTLADGQKKIERVQECQVPVHIKRLIVSTNLIFLPNAKGNRTLLGLDFLKKAGIVLDLRNRCWTFCKNPCYKIPFAKEVELPETSNKKEINLCLLRENEGNNLTSSQREQLDALLSNDEDVFRLGGDPTPYIQHSINTEITPYLRRFSKVTSEVKERVEENQDRRKKYTDQRRRSGPRYLPGDHVWVNLHPLSKAKNKFAAKFAPKRDGPYVIMTQKSLTTYEVASLENPEVPVGTYHTSALTPCPIKDVQHRPVLPLRKRGRPRKDAGPSSGRLFGTRGGV